jgi:hypothetical protein
MRRNAVGLLLSSSPEATVLSRIDLVQSLLGIRVHP